MKKSTLICIYNSRSGFFRQFFKGIFIQITGRKGTCKLKNISTGPLGLKKDWLEFLSETGNDFHFFHQDIFFRKYGFLIPILPAVYLKRGNEWKVILDGDDFDEIQSLSQLKEKISQNLKEVKWTEYPYTQ